jgi:hypothetical protein
MYTGAYLRPKDAGIEGGDAFNVFQTGRSTQHEAAVQRFEDRGGGRCV